MAVLAETGSNLVNFAPFAGNLSGHVVQKHNVKSGKADFRVQSQRSSIPAWSQVKANSDHNQVQAAFNVCGLITVVEEYSF